MRDTDVASKLIEANQRRARLETENELLRKSNNNNLAESKTRCEKLAIEVNGRHHNAELFQKEIAALSADEIRSKIRGYEWQLAGFQRSGRIIERQTSPLQTGNRQGERFNPKVFKIG